VPRVHLFTLLQLGLLGGCWLINLSPLGLCVAHLSPEPSPYPDPYPDPDPDPDPERCADVAPVLAIALALPGSRRSLQFF